MELQIPRCTFFLVLIAISACDRHPSADLVVQNGTIYTVSSTQPEAEAVAVKDGKIVYVGDQVSLASWIGDSTEVLDLEGQTMTPGWIEGHGHFMGMGYNKLQLDLREVKSYDELVDKVAKAVSQSQPGEWILGRGWHQSKWTTTPDTLVLGFQTHQNLSAVSPDNPVYLRHASGHAGFANAKAMEIAGIGNISVEAPRAESPEGGEILRDDLGNPTGVFNERAMTLITKHIPESTEENDLKALELAVENCLVYGITTFHDAGVDQYTIDLYKSSIDQGKMKVRLWVMLSGRDSMLLADWYKHGPEIGYGDNYLTIRSIKMYMDGALGSRGAWLLEPYTDRPGHTGHETTPIEMLYDISVDGLAHGFQVCAHAIGDRANREVLDQYEKAFAENPEAAEDSRFRIEHAQHISADDIPRFKEMGVIAAMQGIHMASDRPWAIDRLGEGRIIEGAYVWQKLLQSGAKIANGSDVPVEPLNPLASFYASVARKTLEGLPPEGYEMDQAMTREQALRSYTLDAAYAGFEEDVKGSIEVGKLADLVVFSKDIMKVAEDQLLQTEVVYTLVNGEVVYRR
ncbi:MAG: amidohydrolase [Cyclobacteriaceae bacterium]